MVELRLGDIVHVLFIHPFKGDEWRAAKIISAEEHKIGVEFGNGELMALSYDDRGRVWK